MGHEDGKSNVLGGQETEQERRELNKPDCEDAKAERRNAERRVDSDLAGVDYLCMPRLLDAVCQPVAKFRNKAEFRKRDFSAGRTTRPPSSQKRMGLESNVRAGGVFWT